MSAYSRAIRRGHLSHAAELYPAHVRAYNRVVVTASVVLSLAALVIGVHLLTQLVP